MEFCEHIEQMIAYIVVAVSKSHMANLWAIVFLPPGFRKHSDFFQHFGNGTSTGSNGKIA